MFPKRCFRARQLLLTAAFWSSSALTKNFYLTAQPRQICMLLL